MLILATAYELDQGTSLLMYTCGRTADENMVRPYNSTPNYPAGRTFTFSASVHRVDQSTSKHTIGPTLWFHYPPSSLNLIMQDNLVNIQRDCASCLWMQSIGEGMSTNEIDGSERNCRNPSLEPCEYCSVPRVDKVDGEDAE